MAEFSRRETELNKEPQIMTFEEYAEKEHDPIYVFELEKGDKKLTYFGADHSAHPDNPMFEQIREKFQESNPQLVFVEGITDLKNRKQEVIEMTKSMSEEEAIKQIEETGFTLKLAVEAGVDFDSPEPDFKEEIQHIADMGFPKEEIFAYYLYRQQAHYFRVAEKDRTKSVQEYLQPLLREFKETSDWQDFDYSLENLQKIAHDIWGERGDIVKDDTWRTNPVPYRDEKSVLSTNVNRIAQQSSYFRDAFVIRSIEESLKENDRLFIIFGSSHAVMQEPALRKMFENKNEN